MDCILNILKPPGMTSFDVVAVVRHQLNGVKTGHAGTLDPIAAGVLPICAGKSTRLLEYITADEKRYTAEITLGIETDTYDTTGTVVGVNKAIPGRENIISAISGFIGEFDQIPPIYSAIKVDGRKLYESARKGQTPEIKPRRITIHSINIKDVDGPKVIMDVHCSKGTYIRSLCHDIGAALGCGATMSFLVRTSVGLFDIRDSLPVNELESVISEGRIGDFLIHPRAVLNGFSEAVMEDDTVTRLLNGLKVPFSECMSVKQGDSDKNILAVYDKSDRIVAIAAHCNEGGIKTVKMAAGKSLI